MSDCLTCEDSAPAGPAQQVLPPLTNPDIGDIAAAAGGNCPAVGQPSEACTDGYRVPRSIGSATAPAACQQFELQAPCPSDWAYAGLLVELHPLGHAEVISASSAILTLKNLTLTEGVTIPVKTQIRPIPRAPMGQDIFSVPIEDVEDPAEAEEGIVSSDIRFPVGVPVTACGASAEASRVALRYRKGMCGIPLTSAADQTQFMLVGWNPLTKCFHFFPNGTEGDALIMKGGRPSWENTAATKYVYDYTGQQQQLVIPAGFTQARLKIWGAGGSEDGGVVGGCGGYTMALVPVTVGDILSIVVGEGISNKVGRTYGFGGGGQGIAHQHNGGGLSGVFTGADSLLATDFARALAIAGGGGSGGQSGGGGNASQGGPGNIDAGGATQTDMQGRDASGSQYSGGGGGGGGYRGGGYKGLGGHGGSGFVVGSAVEDDIQAAVVGATAPPNTTDPDYKSGIGRGGQPGRVVIELIE